MANIMDLFSATEVVETSFDISGIASAYEKIAAAQTSVGGRPTLKAKVGSGGVKVFTISNGNRDIIVESFRGVIIAHHKNNALFEGSGDEKMNTPPICSSTDGILGADHRTGECKNCETCPYNEFGSAGKGKACKNMHRLYILVEGSPIPVTLTIPPTSLELWSNYALMDVAASGLEMSEVVTEFSLTNAMNEAGQKYSLVNFKLVGKVSREVVEFCEKMGSAIEQSPRLAIAPEDYNREPVKVLAQSDVPLEDIIDELPHSAEVNYETVGAGVLDSPNNNDTDAIDESEPEEIDIDSL